LKHENWISLLFSAILWCSLATASGCGGSDGGVTLTNLVVAPTSPSIAVGGTVQFTATAHFSDGTTADVTVNANWSSSLPNVGTIASLGTQVGLATGVSAGTTTITAQFAQGSSTISSATDLTVTATDIKLSPLVEGTATVRFPAASGSAGTKLLIDGQPVAMRTNGIATIVELPAGRHRFASRDGRRTIVTTLRGQSSYVIQSSGEGLLLTKE